MFNILWPFIAAELIDRIYYKDIREGTKKMTHEKSLLNVSLQEKKSVVERIVNQITEAIIKGELKPGDKIPTEVDLCESFQVGRNSIREAIKILEAYGVVYIKRAEGTFVSDSYNQKMLDPMLYGIILQKDSAEEIIVLRKVIDIGILQVAIQRLTDEQLAVITDYLNRLEYETNKEAASVEKILEADLNFHMAITMAIDNELLASMYNYVDRITIPSRTHAIELILKTGERKSFIELHRQLLDLIKNKDLEKIERTVSEHYVFWQTIK
ncbi:MAG: FadR family transcriptional regulator [Clostridia bacterium]|jgi:DNA-binding FadR family transcriptional regulator|nr:FadR family transcriptional regulator [Clostridia bacterium]